MLAYLSQFLLSLHIDWISGKGSETSHKSKIMTFYPLQQIEKFCILD